ncbi:MAG: acyltransferase [Myxococcales bacterium]|nr:acyltransferase [Myxococcales bacterium]
MSAASPQRIPSLDGLRALSIALVILSHLLGTQGFPYGPRALGTVGDFGYLGVKVFFVISGYLITRLLMKEHDRSGTISLRGFYVRRVWRIFPAFYAFIIAMVVAWQLGAVDLSRRDLIAAVTYTMNYHYDRSWQLGHIWSLSIEEQFYLVWPFLFVLAGRARVVSTATVIIVLALACRAAAWFYFRSDDLVEEAYPCVMDSIAVGCLMAGIQGRLDTAGWYQRFLRSPLFLAVPVVIAVTQYPAHPALQYTVGTTIENLAIAVFIDRAVRMHDDPFGRVLNWRPLVWVGTLSYSLYLWQEPFLDHNQRSFANAYPLNLVLACLCAVTSYYLIEKPVLDWRGRVAARRRAAAAPLTPS